MSNVRVVKLVTGEEIVSDVDFDKHQDGVAILKTPVLLINIPLPDNPDGTPGGFRPSIFPWAEHVKDRVVRVKSENWIYNEPANEGLSRAYADVTGMVVAPQQSLVLPNRR